VGQYLTALFLSLWFKRQKSVRGKLKKFAQVKKNIMGKLNGLGSGDTV
jgi:hypothetical protein